MCCIHGLSPRSHAVRRQPLLRTSKLSILFQALYPIRTLVVAAKCGASMFYSAVRVEGELDRRRRFMSCIRTMSGKNVKVRAYLTATISSAE
jgi:hypothetical protein